MSFIKRILLSGAIIFCTTFSFAQTAFRKLPEVDLKTIGGESIKSTALLNQEGLTVINFWSTWCKPCMLELNNIKELYSDWQKETKVKIVAVSIDDSRNTSKVGPLVNGKGWLYQIALDPNGDFKRALNVNNIPHTFLLNAKGDILWQHNSYAPGDEDELFEVIKKNTPKP
jgi:thiol-disulfide isomerase/thioredoxin